MHKDRWALIKMIWNLQLLRVMSFCRAGIMNYGQLRCLGTQSHLKSRFGTGYQLHFSCEHGKAMEAEQFIQTRLPSAVHVETYAGTCAC